MSSSEKSSSSIQNTASAPSTDLKQVIDREQQAQRDASQPPITSGSAQSAQAYREAINLASSAYSLSQLAVSPDDWGLIESRWQRAADQLKKVNENSEHYAMAQQKLDDYIRYSNHATAQIQQLQQSVQLPPRPTSTNSAFQPARSTPAIAELTVENLQVPVTRRLHGTPVVQVTFNDAKTYEMILDTGASRTLITRRMADELGVVPTEKMIAATASESEVIFDIAQMSSISIGNVRLLDAKVSIGDSVNIGLLGNDFLKGYDVTIRDRTVELAIAQ